MNSAGRSGFAVIFTIGMLALLSLLGAAFVATSRMEATLGGNYVCRARAQLAAESGLDFALAMIRRDAPGGPIDEIVLRAWGYDFERLAAGPEAAAESPDAAYAQDLEFPGRKIRVSGCLDAGGAAARTVYTVSIADESGKLNLNDPNQPLRRPVDDDEPSWSQGRLFVILHTLVDLVFPATGTGLGQEGGGVSRGRAVAYFLLTDSEVGRAAHPGDRFPSLHAVDEALRHAGLSEAEILRLHDYVTLDTWQDDEVLHPTLSVYGSLTERMLGESIEATVGVDVEDINGWGLDPNWQSGNMADLLMRPVESNLAIQGRRYELEARSPVNINTARLELIQALLQPVQGIFLEEGPAEWQSSEHYGWWSTGMGEPDRNVYNMGTLRQTKPVTAAQAARLARALYDRIHGIDNVDVFKEGAANEPNPFETWEEYRYFLEAGLSWEAARFIFVGEDGFGVDPQKDVPPPYDQTMGYFDTHVYPPLFSDDDAWYKSPTISGTYGKAPILLYDRSGFRRVSWDTSGVVEWWDRYYGQAQRDALYANANPNSLLNDFNPNANVYLMVDKGQLSGQTTEFCFEPTGVFSLRSEGLHLAPDGALLGLAARAARVRLFETRRVSSQARFLAGLRDAENAGEYFSSAEKLQAMSEEGAMTAAHRTAAGRLSLQSYPEPLLPGQESAIHDARHDGSLMLATLEMVDTESSYWQLLVENDMAGDYESDCFFANFNGDDERPLRIDYSINNPNPESRLDCHQGDGNYLQSGPLSSPTGAVHGVPGCLYPDGVYSEKDRVLAYPMGNFYELDDRRERPENPPLLVNVSGYSGYLRFWCKPNFHTGISTRIRKICGGPVKPGRYAQQQFLALYYMANPASNECRGWPDIWQSYVATVRRFSLCKLPSSLAPDGIQYGKFARNYWIPTHSFLFGFAWQDGPANMDRANFVEGSAVSRSVTDDYPLAEKNLEGQYDESYHAVPGHQWSFLGIGWTLQKKTSLISKRVDPLTPNGAWVYQMDASTGYAATVWSRYRKTYTNADTYRHAYVTDMTQEWLRFGELPGMTGYVGRPYYADATFDEISGDGRGSSTLLGLLPYPMQFGRYVSRSNPEDLMPCVARYSSPAISVGGFADGGRELRSVAWTLYRPRHNRKKIVNEHPGYFESYPLADNVESIVVNPNDRPDPMARFWDDGIHDGDRGGGPVDCDPISVDVRLPGTDGGDEGDWLFGAAPERRFTYPGGSVCEDAALTRYAPGDTIQFRLHFHLREGQWLYESPVLDDFTFTMWLARPAILAWEAE